MGDISLFAKGLPQGRSALMYKAEPCNSTLRLVNKAEFRGVFRRSPTIGLIPRRQRMQPRSVALLVKLSRMRKPIGKTGDMVLAVICWMQWRRGWR
jgi:hypothetical protein